MISHFTAEITSHQPQQHRAVILSKQSNKLASSPAVFQQRNLLLCQQSKRIADKDPKKIIKCTHQTVTKSNSFSSQIFHCMFLITSIFKIVEENQTLQCNFIHLFIPLAYIQAHKLTLLKTQNRQQTYSYDLFKTILKKIQQIKQIEPLQIQEKTFYEVISDCLSYYKHVEDKNPYYLQKLKGFLEKHQTAMNNYMPVYYQYFSAVANYSSIFGKQTKVTDIQVYLEKVKQRVAGRYSKTVLL